MSEQYLDINDLNASSDQCFIVDMSDEGCVIVFTDKQMDELTEKDRYLAAARLCGARYMDLLDEDEALAEAMQTVIKTDPSQYTPKRTADHDYEYALYTKGYDGFDAEHVVWGWRIDL